MLLEYGWHMIRSITKIHLRVIELSKWACLATRKEENYKFISKQVLLIDKHKHIKRGIPGKPLVIPITKRNYTVIEIYASF